MNSRLEELKKKAFPPEGKDERVAKALAALHQELPIEISLEDLRRIVQDGDPLPGGLAVSLAGGSCVPVYRCICGREQAAECEGFNGGISEQVAQSVGWNLGDRGWMCPFCSSETDKLFQVFSST